MCVAGWTSSGADCEARAVAEVEDVVERVLLRPKRDVAGRVLLRPKRDVAGRVLLGPERDVAGRVAVADESRGRASCCEAQEGRGRGLSSWEEVAKKERERRTNSTVGRLRWWQVRKRETMSRVTKKNKGVPKHRCGVLAQ